ncbi:PREDICTED: F-box [Prunus dulcis]|uniref:PREDICTED: F-box n=1 Tax=Prunus dulcis TaxID=3755 RepID=A0A5E4EDJ2_PRUDU|nr:uncharacterized protein LOC117615932 [Prunus dulcis]KAI5355501.1 hypothetical protein L3X38_008396 [Prunus dulcis]VVA13765.1 PREDICTED: F-box [Prunus dulcis]
MAESENPLLNEFCAAAAQSRRLLIRLKGPGPCPVRDPNAGQCLKQSVNVCKSFNRNRIADNGIQESSDAKHVARSAKIPEFSTNTLMSSKHDNGSMKLLSGFVEQNQFKANTLCRSTRGDTAAKARKRTRLPLGLPTSSKLKRSKRSLSAERRTSIDDLPSVILAEILCRLACNKYVFQCKTVSKRWCTLIEDPYFIGCFVRIQSYKGIPKIRTLITKRAVEFRPIQTQALNMFMRFHRLMEKPVVVATYNDLVLCCMTKDCQHIYYICNACTMQYVVLPPTPSRCHKSVRVGFICNVPDYKCEEDDWKGNNFQHNVECRYTVVRILPPVEFENGEKKCDTFKLNVEIFSSDTGEWRESVVSSPQHFNFGRLKELSFTYNGMLYWLTEQDFIVIGLGPFYDNDGTSSSNNNGDGIIDHKLGFTIFEETLDFGFMLQYSGVCRGYVLLCNMSMLSRSLYVYELKQSQDDGGAAAGKKLYLSKRRVYSFDAEMIPFKSNMLLIAFDPSNKDIFYLRVDDDIIKWNVHTGKWSKISRHWVKRCDYYTVVLPWWPTSIPRLPQQQQRAHLC